MGHKEHDEADLNYMATHPVADAVAIGRREPYYLEYLRQGKPNPKPKERSEDGIHNE